MRALWTHEEVTFHGRWHDIVESGITLFPVQRPIPIWFGGGHSDLALERIGRMADGWIASGGERSETERQIATIHASAIAAGRSPADIGIQGRMSLTRGGPEDWLGEAKTWEELGATHIAVSTSRAGFTTPAEHLELAERFLNEVGRQIA